VKVKEHVGCAPHTIKVMVGTAQPTKRISCCLLVFLVSSVALCSGAGSDASSKQRAATVSSVPQSVPIHRDLQDANTPETQAAEDSSQEGLYVAAKTSSEITQQLLYNGTIAPESRQSGKNRQELQRLIAQVRSIKFEPKSRILGPAGTIKPVLTSLQGEPSEVSSITQTTKQIVKKGEPEFSLSLDSQAAMDKLSYQPVSAQTLQMLENLEQSAVERLHNPMQLAEILFLSGHLKQAATFYQQALNRIDPNDVMSAQDKAWILFQIGNCLRENQGDQPEGLDRSKSRQALDGAEAKKMYRRLIEECPNCPWADLAMSRENLIDWFLNDEPEKLIEENKF